MAYDTIIGHAASRTQVGSIAAEPQALAAF